MKSKPDGATVLRTEESLPIFRVGSSIAMLAPL